METYSYDQIDQARRSADMAFDAHGHEHESGVHPGEVWVDTISSALLLDELDRGDIQGARMAADYASDTFEDHGYRSAEQAWVLRFAEKLGLEVMDHPADLATSPAVRQTYSFDQIERCLNAGEVALHRHWNSIDYPERDNVTLEQSAQLWGAEFVAELGPDAGVTAEQASKAWMEIELWLDGRKSKVPALVWATQLCADLGLTLAMPAREDVIPCVGRFPSSVVEAVARSLDPFRWDEFDDPIYEGTPLDQRVRLVGSSITSARDALLALEATGYLDAEATVSA